MPATAHRRSAPRGVPKRTLAILGMLSIFAPISLDLYLPRLPQLADDLGASASAAQLSLTTCMLGLALGQVIAGAASDRFGRRLPLMIGLAAYVAASALCALAPSISVLLLVRFIQGVAGAAGIVIAQAVGRDLYSRREDLIRFSSGIVSPVGLAAVAGPVLGGQLARFMSWRGIFAGLTVLGFVLLLAGAAGLPETLPAARRSTGGLRGTLHGFRLLRKDRLYMGVALSMAIAGASIFAYLAGATFVLQKIYGLSPQGYSLAFALNSLGFMVLGQLSGRLARRWPAAHLFAAGLALNLVGAASLCAVTLWHLPLVLLLASLFVLVSAIALATPPATALALAEYPSMAGAASSLLGFFGMVCGAAAAPVVGIAGERSAIPLGIVALSLSVGGTAIFRAIVWPRTRTPQHDHTAVPDPRGEVQPCAPTA